MHRIRATGDSSSRSLLRDADDHAARRNDVLDDGYLCFNTEVQFAMSVTGSSSISSG